MSEKRSWLKAAAPYLRWLFAALVLAFLFTRFPGSEVLGLLSGVHPGWALGALGLTLVSQVVVAIRLKLYTDAQGIPFSVPALLDINLATAFYALFLPGGSMPANAIRFYRISAPQRKYAGTAVALLLDRLAATLALAAVGVFTWLIADPIDGEIALAVMAAAMVAIIVIEVALRSEATGRLGAWMFSHLPERLAVPDAKELLRAGSGNRGLRVAVLSVLAHVISIFAYVCVARSLGLDLTLGTIAWTRSAAILAAMLPVSVAGLGVRESAFLVLLAPYGILGEEAIAYSLAIFVLTMVGLGLIGGVPEAGRLFRQKRSVGTEE